MPCGRAEVGFQPNLLGARGVRLHQALFANLQVVFPVPTSALGHSVPELWSPSPLDLYSLVP